MNDEWTASKIQNLRDEEQRCMEAAKNYRRKADEYEWEAEVARKTAEFLTKCTADE